MLSALAPRSHPTPHVTSTRHRPREHLEAQHAQCRLEQHQGALIEKQVPDAQQELDMHDAGEGREEPVQRDQGQLCGQAQESLGLGQLPTGSAGR